MSFAIRSLSQIAMIVLFSFFDRRLFFFFQKRNGAWGGWLSIAGFSVQPAEVLKVLLSFWFFVGHILLSPRGHPARLLGFCEKNPMAIVLAYTVILAFYPDFGRTLLLCSCWLLWFLLASGLNYVYTLILGGATVLFSFFSGDYFWSI